MGRVGRVRMLPVRNALPRYLHAFVEQCLASGSTIRTDGWHGYAGLAQKGYLHEPLSYWQNWDLDGDFRGRRRDSRMRRVDWVAGRLKRWLVGTHAGAVSQAQPALLLGRVHVPIQRAPLQGPWEALRASPAASGDHRANSVSRRRRPLAFAPQKGDNQEARFVSCCGNGRDDPASR